MVCMATEQAELAMGNNSIYITGGHFGRDKTYQKRTNTHEDMSNYFFSKSTHTQNTVYLQKGGVSITIHHIPAENTKVIQYILQTVSPAGY